MVNPHSLREAVKRYLLPVGRFVFSRWTLRLIYFDIIRFWARFRRQWASDVDPESRRLHFGCGAQKVPGWLNVDVLGSEYDVDLAAGNLPWKDDVFDHMVGQHVIEHLELEDELLPLLRELYRVGAHEGELWVSCPDMERACRSYLNHQMKDLIEDRQSRFPNYSMEGKPPQHMLNELFHQWGHHRNLYDFGLLSWALASAGFSDIRRSNEPDFLARYPGFRTRNDDYQSLYVRAIIQKSNPESNST